MKIVYMCTECDGTEFKELDGYIVCSNEKCGDSQMVTKEDIEKEGFKLVSC